MAVYSNDKDQQYESSGLSETNSPPEIQRLESKDSLSDPDEGKSAEERAQLDKKLVRKMDMWIVPWLSLLYLLSFLDRTNIGNARLAGLEEDLGMEGHDYNNALTIFFVSYALAEPATNVLLKLCTPRIFFTAIILLWGICMTLMGLVTSYAGLLGARFALGLAEAGLYPGAMYYMSCWYKRSELGMRAAIFFSMAALAGSFGGLLAAAISQMDGIGGKAGWAWIFILEGLATVVVGIASWWMVFDWPETARFLKPDERIRARRRLDEDGQARTDEKFDKNYIIAAAKDWKTWGFAICYIGFLVPLYAFSLFVPTILGNGLGYKGTTAQLLSVPPYAAAAVNVILIGWIGDRTRQRGFCNIACASVGAIGFVMLLSTPNADVQYAALFLAAVGIYPLIPNTVSWVSNNVEGVYKRGIVIGTVVGSGNLHGIVSSNIFLSSESPRFWTGHAVCLGFITIGALGGSAVMHIMLKRENAKRRSGKRDDMLAGKTLYEIKIAGDRNPNFTYVT